MDTFKYETRLTKALFAKNYILACEKGKSNFSCASSVSCMITTLPGQLSWKCAGRGQALGDLALQDIEAKLKEDNVVTETFSSLAAQCVLNQTLALIRILSPNNRHPGIMAIGWKHLRAKLKTERTTTSVLELVIGMKKGDAAHRANALKFGLYEVLRQKDPAEGTLALLRCCDNKCPANKVPVSQQSLRGKIVCPDWRHFLGPSELTQCSECGHLREDHYTWCKGCQRLFK